MSLLFIFSPFFPYSPPFSRLLACPASSRRCRRGLVYPTHLHAMSARLPAYTAFSPRRRCNCSLALHLHGDGAAATAHSRMASITAIAAAASTQGNALGTMQGSCLPLISISTFFSSSYKIVFCFLAIDGVGLNATRNIIGIPLEIPPSIPP